MNQTEPPKHVRCSAHLRITGIHCRSLLRLLCADAITPRILILRSVVERQCLDWLGHDSFLLERQVSDESRHFGQCYQVYELMMESLGCVNDGLTRERLTLDPR